MLKLSFFLLFICFVCVQGYAQSFGSFRDSLEGKNYRTVHIGNQIWLAQNLDVAKFRNGDVIPQAKTNLEWATASEKMQPAWCYYQNNLLNGQKFGKLYNWFAVNDPRGLAPTGWKIPDISDWSNLITFLGEDNAGLFLKNSTGWNHNGNGSNILGMSAGAGGIRNYMGTFYDLGFSGNWWSTSDENSYTSWLTKILCTGRDIDFFNNANGDGVSIRLCKDTSFYKKIDSSLIKTAANKNTWNGSQILFFADNDYTYTYVLTITGTSILITYRYLDYVQKETAQLINGKIVVSKNNLSFSGQKADQVYIIKNSSLCVFNPESDLYDCFEFKRSKSSIDVHQLLK